MTFCVYLTIYNGNKLPPFYIGSSSIKNIHNGYHGSITSKKYKTIWKSELKNNYNLFKTKIISIHSTREDATKKEYILQKKLNVVISPMYINMSFATKNGFFGMDVSGKNNPFYGKKLSKEHSQKISGKNHGMYGTSNYKIWLNKFGKEEADKKLLAQTIKKSKSLAGKNNGMYGKEHPLEWRINHSLKLSKKCTIDNGITIFKSRKDLIAKYGNGKRGAKHPLFTYI